MHQTYYIDIDEEITSIVERLRNSKSNEVVIVVPKRALLIQSIVNLRLLKKEADNLGLLLSIVTQDPLGKVLIEKAGISYQAKLDDFAEGSISDSANRIGENIFESGPYSAESGLSVQEETRMDKIGTDSYFSEIPSDSNIKMKSSSISLEDAKRKSKIDNQTNNEKIINKELVTGIGDDMKKKRVSMDVSSPSVNIGLARDINKKKDFYPQYLSPDKSSNKASIMTDNPAYQSFNVGSSGDKKIDNFFQYSSQQAEKEKNSFKNSNLSKHVRKMFVIFGIILIIVVLGAAAYLFLPKAEILITAKTSQKVQDVQVKGNTNVQSVDYENKVIPVKLISETAEVSKEISSSGSKSASGKKARGTLTIYNEFSSASQPLVATTRFESESGKIFRIIKGVTVPGTTKVEGETKPGVIEVEVEADETGESYNIGPGKFSIPGFKGSGNDKYAKIYAKSNSAMTGGGSEGSGTENKSVSETDISGAKSQLQTELKAALKEKIKNSTDSKVIVLDDAINLEEPVYSFSNSAGEVVEKFQAKGQIKGTALVFNENDLKSIISKVTAESGNDKVSIDISSISISYGKADVDFKAESMTIKASGKSIISSEIDLENFKEGILGKTNEELETYLGTYSSIEKADVIYWPPFMNNKVPIYEKRVEVVVESDTSG